ncbi:MAG: sensor histidine kinase [Akkermansiaceae bacterium]
MNRPWVIWCVSGLIALLVFGAMGVITQHTLGLEKETAHAEAKAELEGRIRIALWRMDTYAAGILAEENNRPAWHFRDVDLQRANRLTPLNVDVPENVKLHFEINSGTLTTPQVNGWNDGGNTWSAALAPVQQGAMLSKKKQEDFMNLRNLIYRDATFSGWQENTKTQAEQADNNLGVICAVASRQIPDVKESDAVTEKGQQQIAELRQQRMTNPKNKVRSMKGYQTNYSASEKVKRNEIVKKSVVNRGGNNPFWEQEQKKNDAKAEKDSKPEANKAAPDNPTQQSKFFDSIPVPNRDVFRQQAQVSGQDVIEGAYQSPLQPLWLGGELVLVRQVQDSGGKRVQGVWLDAEGIRNELISNISDLLPGAKLEPVRASLRALLGEELDPNAGDPMVLAALPWRLVPGEMVVASPGGWTPMRKTLGIAWVGALLAALAAIVLLRGVVKLSERRASFVSSVTHELRTPLTTFGLYSDMLAEGMVQDEEKKQNYLNTLRKESARLTHLVENVLAYSRIERGSARARVEEVEVGSLIDRMCERLRKRAEEVGMELRCDVPEDLARSLVTTDTTAVEQIIFNLVDNASKYAGLDVAGSEGNIISLRALERGKHIVFQVSDQGPGIAAAERKRLFRAFHKSAQEAAHSKPGVGLGLALCRRLARALGGDLRIADCEQGACFELLISH